MRRFRYSSANNNALAHNGAHQFASHHALRHYASNSIYTFIPKNGCSTMRLSLAIANGCIPGPERHNWIHNNNNTFTADLAALANAAFTFVILRKPHSRLASVYLDKLVNRDRDLWQLRDATDRTFQPDELTFRRFVEIVARPGILNSNNHWRPQVDFLVYQDYDLWIPLENLLDYASEIQSRTGIVLADARTFTQHGTDRFSLVSDACFADTPPYEILQMQREGQCPAHEAMYDDALLKSAMTIYSRDFELYDARVTRTGAVDP